MLAWNRRTINPASGTVILVVWALAGAVAGAALGALASRGAAILRLRRDDFAAFLAAIGVGHLLLPLGVGPALALAALGARLARRALWPTRSRLDRGILLALVALAADRVAPENMALAPELRPGAPLAADAPRPGSLPVTLTIHPPVAFPEVPAVHVELRPLRSDAPGQRAALLTGRLPARTNAGPDGPRAVFGGGGLSRVPPRPGSAALARLFPAVTDVAGTAFEPAGALADLARSAGIPVLDGPPSGDDPPLYIRVLEMDAAPSAELAARFTATGAWLDVAWDADGDAELALAGHGISRAPMVADATLMDVAPTVLHLLGLAVPRDVDGRVLMERLARPGPGEIAPRYRPLASTGSASGRAGPASAATTSR